MTESLADQVMRQINQTADLYYRLLTVVAPAGAGKTSALREVQKRTGAPLININLELSLQMLDLTERQRALQLPRILGNIVDGVDGEAVLLDNIEILFDLSLRQDPLRLLLGLSRNKTIIVAWNGTTAGGQLSYAAPEHPEYKRYPTRDFLVASPEAIA